MQDLKRIRKWHLHPWIKPSLAVLICAAFCGVLAWAQKSGTQDKEGITLADLGVTAAQKTQLEALWELKRQRDIQAVNDLKTLNRLAKDVLAEDAEIQKTLDEFRAKRKEVQKQIEEIEDRLVETLPPRAQLHLTVLGVLDNGVPRRPGKSKAGKKTNETSKPAPAQRPE